MYELKDVQKRKYFQKNLNISITFEERKIYGLFGKDLLKKDLASIMALHTVNFSGHYLRNGEEIRTDRKMAREIYYQKNLLKKYHRQTLRQYLHDKKLLLESYDHLFMTRMLKKYDLNKTAQIQQFEPDQFSALQYLIAMSVRSDLVIIDDFQIQDDQFRASIYEDLLKRQKLFQSTVVLLKEQPDDDIYDAYLVMKDGKIIFDVSKNDVLEKAHMIRVEKSDRYFDGKNILGIQEHSSYRTLLVFDRLTDQDLEYIQDHEYELSNMDIGTLIEQIEGD